MKHKTWFRLVLKAIGVLFVGLSVQLLAYPAGIVVDWLLTELFGVGVGFYQWGWALSHLFAGLVLGGGGLYLFFGGAWIVNMAIPSNRPYCPECGYELSHNCSAHCPECGTPIAHPATQRASPTPPPRVNE